MEFCSSTRGIGIISFLQIIVSLTFWTWAVVNMVTGKMKFDGGTISFATAFIAGLTGMASVRGDGDRRVLFAERYIRITFFSHSLVTVNYTLGAVGGSLIKFRIYCGVCAFLWAVTGFLFTRWTRQWIRKEVLYSGRSSSNTANKLDVWLPRLPG